MGMWPTITKKWADERADAMYELWDGGSTLAQVCHQLNICKDSYYKACKVSKKFAVADKMGRLKSEAHWSAIGQGQATGELRGSPITYKFMMGNMFGYWDSRIKQETTLDADVSLKKLTDDKRKQIADKIKQQLKDDQADSC